MAKKKTSKKIAIQDQIKNVPAHLQGAGPVGNENVGADDLTIPRLNVLQALSPEVGKSNPKYVEGAEAGMLINTLTKELYESVKLVPVYYAKEFPVFVKREKGGGYKGNFPNRADAEEFVEAQPNKRDLDIVETATHYCLMLDDDSNIIGQVIFPMASTKLQFSRSWNSMISQRHDSRFACAWDITTVAQSNDKGDFYNLTIKSPGEWVSEKVFKEASNTYQTLSSALSKAA